MPPRDTSVFTSHKMTLRSGRKNILFSHPLLFSYITETAHCLYYAVPHDGWERDLSHSDTSQFREVLLLFLFTCVHLRNRELGLKYSISVDIPSSKSVNMFPVLFSHLSFLHFHLPFSFNSPSHINVQN